MVLSARHCPDMSSALQAPAGGADHHCHTGSHWHTSSSGKSHCSERNHSQWDLDHGAGAPRVVPHLHQGLPPSYLPLTLLVVSMPLLCSMPHGYNLVPALLVSNFCRETLPLLPSKCLSASAICTAFSQLCSFKWAQPTRMSKLSVLQAIFKRPCCAYAALWCVVRVLCSQHALECLLPACRRLLWHLCCCAVHTVV